MHKRDFRIDQGLTGIVSRSDLLEVTRQLHEDESRSERFLMSHSAVGP